MAFMVLDSEVSYTSLRRSRPRRRSLVQSDNSEFCIGVQSMLLTSTGVISRSQQEESVLLLRKIEESNKNTARLIVEAGKLIQESKQVAARANSLQHPSQNACTATMMCGLL